jgi:hypothetical protein
MPTSAPDQEQTRQEQESRFLRHIVAVYGLLQGEASKRSPISVAPNSVAVENPGKGGLHG